MPRVKKNLNLKTQSMSKRKKLSGVDRISDLPDSLLCHILSFLPSTKEVVGTSILSSRWTTLWTHVPYLHFDDSTKYSKSKKKKKKEDSTKHSSDNDKRMSFTHFVCRVLALLKAPTVETFRLNCGLGREDIDPFHLNTWICTALGRGLKELDLSDYGSNAVRLPRSAFTCESLVVLKLGDSGSLNCPSYIHLPSLKILHLASMLSEDDVNKVISGCPILEELHIVRDVWTPWYVPTFNISAPTLKRLLVYISGAKIQISTPSLDNLVIRDPDPVDYLLNNLPNLVEAEVDLADTECENENYADCVLKLLRGLYNVKILSFSHIASGINISFDDLPLFHNLVNLKLEAEYFECNVLKALLENSPNLKVLGIDKSSDWRETCWSQPSRVPECLSSHLETFKFRGFDGSEHELEFVKYILKNGLVLETIAVYTCHEDLEEKFNLIKKLSMFPRGSNTCQLAFHYQLAFD